MNSPAWPLTTEGGGLIKAPGHKTAKSTALFIPLGVLEPSALRWLLATASGSDPQILFDLCGRDGSNKRWSNLSSDAGLRVPMTSAVTKQRRSELSTRGPGSSCWFDVF